MKLIVDQCQRYAKMRAHTATHLLHTQLAQIFKDSKQAGSLVDQDYLRFDFNADRLLTQEELAHIEKRINQIIYISADVIVQDMSLQEATEFGAKAFFEDKYGDMVRVVHIENKQLPKNFFQDDNEEYFASFGKTISMELCWWTHVSNTKDIWCFAILSQEAVASGIKRITAVTWPKVSARIHEVQEILDDTVAKLWIKTATQLADKLDKTLKEYDEMKSSIESLETTMIKQILEWSDFSSWKDLDKVFVVPAQLNFKNVVFQAKWMCKGQNILMYTKEWNFVLLADKWVSAKLLAEKLGLKWGGTDGVIQGRDEKVLQLFK